MLQDATVKVTKIEQKDIDTYELSVEKSQESEQLIVTAQSLITLELLSPRVISMEEYTELIRLTAESLAYQKALNYLSYRKRSVYEIEVYLKQKQAYSADTAKKIIAKLLAQGYLDDASFIQSFLNDAFITSTKGPRKIAFELKQKYGCSENDS